LLSPNILPLGIYPVQPIDFSRVSTSQRSQERNEEKKKGEMLHTNVKFAKKGHKMMLTHRENINITHNHHVITLDCKHRIVYDI
jgi:hypothetical protein